MKRFWTDVAVVADPGGHAIRLDDRPVRTPGRRPLLLPTRDLADAVAAEWAAVADVIDPRAMRLTGLANAAIDIVAPDPPAFIRPLAAYADSDLLIYRADAPDSLVAAQAAAWDPPLVWAGGRFDVAFTPATGIIHRPQPPATLDRLAAALTGRPPFRLAGLSPLVTIGGSLVVALAVDEGALTADDGWAAVTVDEQWQQQRWGEDAEATAVLAARRTEWMAAARFLALLD
ncbi:chaperone required for assembly of F1-ATPase [Sphingomonas jejuensis]|uniref:Chaperone required for assembly of F1-ATPase n=1 Tax=Sphingomonas jejuensis TaxID=904715 RepID=A0ABX0XPV7_9SPHN|nr:chaperone required for assembly of F1-ATPase [Sphingomonas jejuensis]